MLALISCGKSGASNGKIKIVATVFPVYDWIRQTVGDSDNVDITLLNKSGTDLHSYQPTADDIIKIAACDMFVYVGGESDKWVQDALKEKQNRNMVVINLLDALESGKKTEELKEGMQESEIEDGDTEYDEHIWLSVKNAVILCDRISEGICKIDPLHVGTYKLNRDIYIEKLKTLDNSYTEALKSTGKKTLVFGDRFPFRYLTDDYGIDYFAAFAGCSAESEASFKTIVFLANKIDELGLDSIIKIEGSSDSLPKTINENTKRKTAKILTLNSMQSVTAEQMNAGITYVDVCEKNLEVLKEALK